MSTVVEQDPRTALSTVERRVCLTGVDWSTFWNLATTSRGGRMAFDRGTLEIMSPGPLHESYKDLLAYIVRVTARCSNAPRRSAGSTTWGQEDAGRGIEGDDCYYLTREKIGKAKAALARKSNNSNDFPPPDLAIEVDLSRPEVDRSSIYAVIGVAEVWRFDGTSVSIDQLSPDMTYVSAETSRFLGISASEIRRWLVKEDSDDLEAWEDRLADWARTRFSPKDSSTG
jgi:Uma2 family endonuclease